MPRVYMLHKPAGVVTARTDATQKTVMELLPPAIAAGLHPIGRLDIDTSGLLLLTDDGQLTHALMQPNHHVPKTYRITAIGTLTPEKITALQNGIPLDACGTVSRPAEVQLLQECTVADIAQALPADRRDRYLKNPTGAAFLALLTIHEGKKHQVKRMMRAVGCRVCRLERIAIGGLRLDDTLPVGKFRPLTDTELQLLLSWQSTGEHNVQSH